MIYFRIPRCQWTCCFFDGKRPTEPNQTYCADVWTTDLNSRERRREVEKNITNGNYWAWDDYKAPFILKNMICSDNDVDKFLMILWLIKIEVKVK